MKSEISHSFYTVGSMQPTLTLNFFTLKYLIPKIFEYKKKEVQFQEYVSVILHDREMLP